MTLLEYLKQLMGRKEPEPAPASVERSEPNEPAATKSSPGWGLLGETIFTLLTQEQTPVLFSFPFPLQGAGEYGAKGLRCPAPAC